MTIVTGNWRLHRRLGVCRSNYRRREAWEAHGALRSVTVAFYDGVKMRTKKPQKFVTVIESATV